MLKLRVCLFFFVCVFVNNTTTTYPHWAHEDS